MSTVAEIIDLPADSDLAEERRILTRHRDGPATVKNGQTDPGTGDAGSRDHPGWVGGAGATFIIHSSDCSSTFENGSTRKQRSGNASDLLSVQGSAAVRSPQVCARHDLQSGVVNDLPRPRDHNGCWAGASGLARRACVSEANAVSRTVWLRSRLAVRLTSTQCCSQFDCTLPEGSSRVAPPLCTSFGDSVPAEAVCGGHLPSQWPALPAAVCSMKSRQLQDAADRGGRSMMSRTVVGTVVQAWASACRAV